MIAVGYIFGLIWYIVQIVGSSQLSPFLRLKTIFNLNLIKEGKNMTRKKLIIGIVILIAAVLIANEIIDYLPYFIGGAPLPLFGISNFDTKNHSVKVQIFDSNNKSLFDKTYELGDSRSEAYTAQYPEKRWKDVHEKERLFPKGTYTFIVTMDTNVSKTQQIKMDDDRIASIGIDNNGNIDIKSYIT